MNQFYLTQKMNSIVSTVLILLGLKAEHVGKTSATTTAAINFNTRNALGLYSFKAAMVFLLFASFGANAQIGVTVTGNANTTPNLAASYTSLASALTAVNAVTAMSGPITLTCDSGTSETAPIKGFVLGSATLNPVLSSTNTITINRSGAGANY
jgi:hypothetical protein